MYYSLDIYPRLSPELAAGIDTIRHRYDPCWGCIEPHIDIAFPATRDLDLELLSAHVEHVSESWKPFKITLGGFQLRHDWLFLLLQEGADVIARMNQEVYTGYLTPYRKPPREGHEFLAHIGLGLFIKPGGRWDWRDPEKSDFDQERYQEALLQAERLPLPEIVQVKAVCITAIPDVVTEFTVGKRSDFPIDEKMIAVREFRLLHRGTEM